MRAQYINQSKKPDSIYEKRIKIQDYYPAFSNASFSPKLCPDRLQKRDPVTEIQADGLVD